MIPSTFKLLPKAVTEKKTSRLIPKSCFTSDENDETSQSFYEAEDGSVATGIWECPPCRVDIDNYPVNEMMTIISGALIITNAVPPLPSAGVGEAIMNTTMGSSGPRGGS